MNRDGETSYVNFYATMDQLGLTEAELSEAIKTGWLKAAFYDDRPDRPYFQWNSVLRFARILCERGELRVSDEILEELKIEWKIQDEEWLRAELREVERTFGKCEPFAACAADAAKIGADELQNRLEWKYRDNPEELRRARAFYRLVCAELAEQLEKAAA